MEHILAYLNSQMLWHVADCEAITPKTTLKNAVQKRAKQLECYILKQKMEMPNAMEHPNPMELLNPILFIQLSGQRYQNTWINA